jgi:hypothetical protein
MHPDKSYAKCKFMVRRLCHDRYIAKIFGQKRVVFFRYELCIERPVNGEFEGLSIGMVYDQNPII